MTTKMKQKWIWGLFVALVAAILNLDHLFGAIDRLSTVLENSTLYDYIRPEPEAGKARVLVADVRHDINGRYTAEIKELLRRDGKRYRMLGRVYGEEDETANWRDLENLLERHKSVVLLEGSVSADGKTIRIRMRNRDGRVDKRAEIELNESSPWTEELSKMIIEGTQELVDSIRAEPLTLEEYKELADTIRDALAQSQTEEERLHAEFQLAYIEGDMAVLTGDTERILKSVKGYERILAEYEGAPEEGPIRFNIGTAFEIVGGKIGNERAKEEFNKAEAIYKKYGNIEKMLKARTARFKIQRREWFENAKKSSENDVSKLIEMSASITRTLSLHANEITGWQGWLSNEERLYIDMLSAAATMDKAKYERTKEDLDKAREYFWEQAKQVGYENNPWVLSILMCREEQQAQELWMRGIEK